MHARNLVELAAIVAAQGPVLVRGTQRLSATALEQYWVASKCRLDRWGHCLKGFQRELTRSPSAGAGTPTPARQRANGPQVRSVLEEILTGEILTRVWAAVLCAHDRRHGSDEAEPIARSVLIGHLEARHRVLTLLVRSPGIDSEAAVKLNHLRRRSERWIDFLVGYLAGLGDLSEFATDARRAKDFADDFAYRVEAKGGRQAWALVQASLQAAFRDVFSPEAANPDLNDAVAASVLACFPPEQFDSTGLFRSLWLVRLSNAARDVQGMIDELLGPAPLRHGPRQHPLQPPGTQNRLRGWGR